MRTDPAITPVRQGLRLDLVQILRPWSPKPGGNTLRLGHHTVAEYADGSTREMGRGCVDVAVDDLARFAGTKRLLGLTDPAQVADALQTALYEIQEQAAAEHLASERAAREKAERLAREAEAAEAKRRAEAEEEAKRNAAAQIGAPGNGG